MSVGAVDGLGVELLPDWTPSKNPGLGRFDVILKVAAEATVPDGTDLRLRLFGTPDGPRLIVLSDILAGLAGPTWRVVCGRLLDIDAAVSGAEAVFGTCVSARVSRQDAMLPVALRAFRDIIQIADEPIAWWRYYNTTDQPVDVRSVRGSAVLWVDDRRLALSGTYNGPAALPPGRAMRGLLSASDLDLSSSATHQIQLVIGDHSSEVSTVTRCKPESSIPPH